jgi:iron complex outermembrane receptor protein
VRALAHDWDNARAEQLDRTLHGLMILECRAHLKGDPRDPSKVRVRPNYFASHAEARPIPALTLAAGLELLDAKFTSYNNAPIYSYADSGALVSKPGNASGTYIPYAPRVGYNARASYVIPSPVGEFESTVAFIYTGSWYGDPGDFYREPAHSLVNLSQTWTSSDDHYHLTLWAKNVGNTHYDAGVLMIAPIAPAGNPGAPALMGLR